MFSAVWNLSGNPECNFAGGIERMQVRDLIAYLMASSLSDLGKYFLATW